MILGIHFLQLVIITVKPFFQYTKGGVFSLGLSVTGALVTFFTGFLIAYINYLMMKKGTDKSGTAALLLPLLRTLISAGYLVAVFFLAPLTPCDPIWLLAGAAAGLTLPMFFFTFLLIRQLKPSDDNQETEHSDNSDKGGDV
ncbi:MAG: hypothetical protein E7631_01295 [Ruminococcaceae bacterium]|nr:hypothetical protein [Oscillospiraceae bacterium]